MSLNIDAEEPLRIRRGDGNREVQGAPAGSRIRLDVAPACRCKLRRGLQHIVQRTVLRDDLHHQVGSADGHLIDDRVGGDNAAGNLDDA